MSRGVYASRRAEPEDIDGRAAWVRLLISLLLATIGGIGLWAHVIVLPMIQVEFGVDRAAASVPYSITMIGFAIGGMLMGRLVDRFGVVLPIAVSAVSLGIGFFLASRATDYWEFIAIQAVLIGMFGSSSVFGPLVADISHWFVRRRGIAVALVASGNYLAGAIWPPIMQSLIEHGSWRTAYETIGLVCVLTMLPLALLLRRRPPAENLAPAGAVHGNRQVSISPKLLFARLALAGIACCVAMAMPQVHIVAYCGDLGYGPARGAQMLSLM
ncbi:MAG: MFS transporter, partial [Burkholderiaceae bacterium]